jgi:hypothetical protein
MFDGLPPRPADGNDIDGTAPEFRLETVLHGIKIAWLRELGCGGVPFRASPSGPNAVR